MTDTPDITTLVIPPGWLVRLDPGHAWVMRRKV